MLSFQVLDQKQIHLIEKQLIRLDERTDYFLKGLVELERKYPLDKSSFIEKISIIIKTIERTQGITLRKEQVFGGQSICYEGIIDMKTGEGKSYTLLIPIIFNALMGKTTYVITTNEYLSSRDYNMAKKTFDFLGLESTFISEEDVEEVKREKYSKKIIYTTLNNLAFDYLRDGLKYDRRDCLLNDMKTIVIDEADHVMIDQALTPIVISRETPENESLLEVAEKAIRRIRKDEIEVDEEKKDIILKEFATDKIEEFFGINKLYESEEHQELIRAIHLNLEAKYFYKKGLDYVIQDEKIKVMDESTGRVEPDKKFETGIHQAIEVKEGVAVTPGSEVISKINTYSFIKLFDNILGASGTSLVDEDIFHKIYNLNVTEVPRSFDPRLIKKEDVYSATLEEKVNKVIEYTKEKSQKGHPVIIVTGSVNESELLSRKFKEGDIDHSLLNAENLNDEKIIVKRAGESSRITISTNMIGRGTDIKIDKEIEERGGLVVIGLNKHIQDRVEDQIIGRTARQGGSGIARYFLSLEDEGFLRNVSESLKEEVENLIESNRLTKRKVKNLTIKMTNYLKKVKKGNFDFELSKQLVYEDLYEKARKETYKKRMDSLHFWDLSYYANPILKRWIERNVKTYFDNEIESDDLKTIIHIAKVEKREIEECFDEKEIDNLINEMYENVSKKYIENRRLFKQEEIDEELQIYLMIIDDYWLEFLKSLQMYEMNQGLLSYNNEDPFSEKSKSLNVLYEDYVVKVEENFAKNVISKIL